MAQVRLTRPPGVWIWAQLLAGATPRDFAWNPPCTPDEIKLGAIPDPDSGAAINQYCLVRVNPSLGIIGASWDDLPPLDQAIWLHAASQHPNDADLAAAIPSQAAAPALSGAKSASLAPVDGADLAASTPASTAASGLSDADAAVFAKAKSWLELVNA
jgi:hypothetical protein